MAVGLMEALDVEVETLDSLFGIDTARLPESAHEFREHAAELRLAFAAAADWPAPVNLLRERNRRRTKTILTRAAVAAGVDHGCWRRLAAGAQRLVAIRPVESHGRRAASPPRPVRCDRCRPQVVGRRRRRSRASRSRFRRPRRPSIARAVPPPPCASRS